MLGLVAISISGCRKTPSDAGQTPTLSQPPQTSYPMPPATAVNRDLGWTIANAQHVRLLATGKKIIVLDFYATWCGPCRESIPHLIELQKRYGDKGLQVVGLNVGGPEDYDKVPAFARELKIQYQLGIPDRELENLYMAGDLSIPLTLVLNQDGVVLKRFIGGDSLDDELEGAIQAALSAD